MSSRRTLILIGALVTGLISALLIYKYVGGIEEKAQGDAQLVNVVIAKDTIRKGENATDVLYRPSGDRRRRTPTDRPSGRCDHPCGRGEEPDRSARHRSRHGDHRRHVRFRRRHLRDGQATPSRDGTAATTVSVDQVHAVAGLVATGDYVNLTVVGQCRLGSAGKLEIDGGSVSGGTGGEGGDAAAAPVETVGCAPHRSTRRPAS
ncbi:MAG: hypothetical protein V9G12_13170, partial [Microthrixaceae bacterium]